MKVLVEGKSVSLTARNLIGQGGEAEVYSYGREKVIKVFKRPDHADFAADPHQVAAAQARLDEHQRKLADFPTGLPDSIVAPETLVLDPSTRTVVGYTMKRIRGSEPLYKLGNARARRARGLSELTSVLLSLHDIVAALHARDIVIGDFNDLNVLVREDAAYLIDADSLQFGRYQCSVFSERFVDPLLCDSGSGVLDPRAPFDQGSDWYAFAIMVARTLLSVAPHGGIHTPIGSSTRVPSHRRPLERLSIFNAPIRLPRPALPPVVLSGDLLAYFEAAFARDAREPMPRSLLECLAWTTCGSCGLDHARTSCPVCAPRASRPPALAPRRTPISAQRVTDPARIGVLRARVAGAQQGSCERVWLEGRRLVRRGRFGPDPIGDVMAAATQLWVGETFGVGFYAAGRLQFGFVFDVDRGGLNDQVRLEPLRGTLADSHAALSRTHAWLMMREKVGPSLETRVIVASRRGAIVSRTARFDPAWLAGFHGACAIGSHLFVPTDDGVVRLEVSPSGDVVVGKSFPETVDHVDAATTLLSDGSALYAITDTEITVLSAS